MSPGTVLHHRLPRPSHSIEGSHNSQGSRSQTPGKHSGKGCQEGSNADRWVYVCINLCLQLCSASDWILHIQYTSSGPLRHIACPFFTVPKIHNGIVHVIQVQSPIRLEQFTIHFKVNHLFVACRAHLFSHVGTSCSCF